MVQLEYWLNVLYVLWTAKFKAFPVIQLEKLKGNLNGLTKENFVLFQLAHFNITTGSTGLSRNPIFCIFEIGKTYIPLWEACCFCACLPRQASIHCHFVQVLEKMCKTHHSLKITLVLAQYHWNLDIYPVLQKSCIKLLWKWICIKIYWLIWLQSAYRSHNYFLISTEKCWALIWIGGNNQ